MITKSILKTIVSICMITLAHVIAKADNTVVFEYDTKNMDRVSSPATTYNVEGTSFEFLNADGKSFAHIDKTNKNCIRFYEKNQLVITTPPRSQIKSIMIETEGLTDFKKLKLNFGVEGTYEYGKYDAFRVTLSECPTPANKVVFSFAGEHDSYTEIYIHIITVTYEPDVMPEEPEVPEAPEAEYSLTSDGLFLIDNDDCVIIETGKKAYVTFTKTHPDASIFYNLSISHIDLQSNNEEIYTEYNDEPITVNGLKILKYYTVRNNIQSPTRTISFVLPTGLEAIIPDADSNQTTEIYSVNGQKMNYCSKLLPGVYIIRKGAKIEKICVGR